MARNKGGHIHYPYTGIGVLKETSIRRVQVGGQTETTWFIGDKHGPLKELSGQTPNSGSSN
jgi:hypothetical protein